MAEFESFAKARGFEPRAVIDTASQVSRQVSQQLDDLRAWQQRNQRLDQQQIDDTKYVGQDIIALGNLTKSGVEAAKTWMIESKTDRDTGDYVDSLFTDPDDVYGSPQEESIIQRGLFEQGLAGEAIANLKEQGDDGTAASIVSKQFKIGAGLAKENALLQQAKVEIPARVQTLLNDSSILINIDGKKIPITELSQDPEYANYAVRYALKLALKERGLNYATKKQFKSVLGGTITNVLQNTTTNLISTAIKLEQTDNRQLLTTGAANMGADYANGTLQLDPQVAFDTLVATNRSRNTGLSKGQINSTIAQSLYAGAGSNKNAILDLADLQTGSGSLGGAYPIILRDALLAADKLGKVERGAQADAMAEAGMKRLQDLIDKRASQQEINREKNRTRDLIAAIDPSRATSFATQAESTYIDTQQDELLNNVTSEIEGGKEFTESQLRARGLNDQNITKALTRQDVSTKTRELNFQIQSDQKALTSSVMNGAGIKYDGVTNQYQLDKGWIDGTLVQRSLDRFKFAKAEYMERWLRSNRNSYQSDSDLNKAYLSESRRFDEQELSINGSYAALGQLRDLKATPDAETKHLIQQQLKTYSSANSVNRITPTRQQPSGDYSQYVVNGNVPLAVRNEWANYNGVNSNLGIFTFKETEDYNTAYNQTGVFPPNVVTASEQLGVSPAQLLNNQNRRYGLPPIKQVKPETYETTFSHQPGPTLDRKQVTEIRPKVAVALMGPDYGLAKPAAVVLAEKFSLIEQKNWKAIISRFALDKRMTQALTNPNLTPKQFIGIYNNFLKTYPEQ